MQEIVEYIGVTQAALKRANDERKLVKQAEAAAKAAIPATVQALVDQGLIPEKHKESAVKALATHASALEVLTKMAGRTVLKKVAEARDAPPSTIGTVVRPGETKQAGDATTGRPENESDRVFRERVMAFRNR